MTGGTDRSAASADLMAGVRIQLITSRLLILQSKRLMLHSLQRRQDEGSRAELNERIEALQVQAERAQHAYRTYVLNWGTTRSSDYWVVAYSRLIEMGNALTTKLREATNDLAPAERYQVSADVEMLEEIVAAWGESLRTVMTTAVA